MKRRILYVMRGLPGSGKTTWIRDNLMSSNPLVVSADDFFLDDERIYHYDSKRIGEAHAMAQMHAIDSMLDSMDRRDVVVDNTNSRRWEWSVLLKVAEHVDFHVVETDLFDGGCSDEELVTRCVHGVPVETIRLMRKRWEK